MGGLRLFTRILDSKTHAGGLPDRVGGYRTENIIRLGSLDFHWAVFSCCPYCNMRREGIQGIWSESRMKEDSRRLPAIHVSDCGHGASHTYAKHSPQTPSRERSSSRSGNRLTPDPNTFCAYHIVVVSSKKLSIVRSVKSPMLRWLTRRSPGHRDIRHRDARSKKPAPPVYGGGACANVPCSFSCARGLHQENFRAAQNRR